MAEHYSEFLEEFNPDAPNVKYKFDAIKSRRRQIAQKKAEIKEYLSELDADIAKHYTAEEIAEAKRQFKLSK